MLVCVWHGRVHSPVCNARRRLRCKKIPHQNIKLKYAQSLYELARIQFFTASVPNTYAQTLKFHMQPLARAHFRTSSAQQNSLARAYCSTSRCPFIAALEQVFASHSQPFSRAQINTSRWPCSAAFVHVSESHLTNQQLKAIKKADTLLRDTNEYAYVHSFLWCFDT